MPILDLQKRARELGRIRIGQVEKARNGKTRPAKLDRFRLTSASRALLDKVAELYGGQVADWQPQGGGAAAYEVVTESTRLPILVPPQPVSQWYELWSGGGCQRRCDGVRDVISDSPCICAQSDERECKPTTRLNVVLRDVEGIGVWRLESHGYYAAVELPNAAMFLEQAGQYVAGTLTLEERVVKREGQTRRFMVPAIEIEGVTPGQLMAGAVRPQAVASADRTAIEAGPSGRDFVAEIKAAGTREAVLAVWNAAKAAAAHGVPVDAGAVEAAAGARVAELDAAAPADGPPPAPAGQSVDALWVQVVAAWPGDSTADIETAFARRYEGLMPDSADAAQLAEFLAAINAGQVTPEGGE